MKMETRSDVELSTLTTSPAHDGWQDEESGPAGETESLLGVQGSSQYDTVDSHQLPDLASRKQQLNAMLRRQWLFKKRGWVQTVMELVSPILMMSLLVLGWSLSTPVQYKTTIFAKTGVPLMESFSAVFSNTDELLQLCPAADLLKQLPAQEELQAILHLLQQEYLKRLLQPGFRPGFPGITSNGTKVEQLLPQQLPIPPELMVSVLQCLTAAQDSFTTLSLFGHYNGLIPVPTFDAFVATHKMIKNAVGGGNGTYDDMVRAEKKLGNMIGNLLHLGLITFAPNSSEVAALVDHMRASYESFTDYYGGTFASEEDAIAAALSDLENQLWAVVVVDRLDPMNGEISYKIRMNYTTVPNTWRVTHKHRHGLLRYYKHYYTSGFLSLQDAINSYVFQNLSMTPNEAAIYAEHPVWGVPFPISEYSHNKFYDAVGPLMGLLMCLCTLYPLAMLVKALVEDKETKAKETMLIMGLRPWIFYSAWFITYLVVFVTISMSVTMLVSSTFFPKSDPSLIFVLFLLFTSSLIPFGFFLSVFFSKSKLAAIVAPFVHFAAIMPRYIFFRASSGQAIPGKAVAALLPSTAFTFGIDMLGQYEGANFGLTWANFMEEEFSFAYILMLLIVDFFIYSALAWYLGQILPSEFGAPLRPWFMFSRSYWLGDAKISSKLKYEIPTHETEQNGRRDVEPITSQSSPAVQIRGLKKVYAGGKVAVEGLDLDIFEGQIMGLLGHNGAGKSTTISMLTGLIRPTSGQAQIWGYNVLTNMKEIRRMIGVCPQQNVLFPHLTVEEHLELYAAIKGVPDKLIELAVHDMVTRVELTDKRLSPASSLSGGMKRKLQVGIAMIGGSRVVFLDEPTSGMDPHARRGMWQLLHTFKNGRAVVLTTHYMDEADVLCDRIAIMSEGRLRCCGSSLFLKARYGVGYHLIMTKGSSDCNMSAVEGFVLSHVPQAIPLSCAGGEISFQLPIGSKGIFADFFHQLEQHKADLHIGSFGVSMTTLEEVFIRLATEGDMQHPLTLTEAETNNSKDELEEGLVLGTITVPVKTSGKDSQDSARTLEKRAGCGFWQAWFELFKKRVIIARRDLKGLLNSVLLPVAVIALVMLILKLSVNPAGPRLQLTYDMYKSQARPDQRIPVFVAGTNATSVASLADDSRMGVQVVSSVNNSVEMSSALLSAPPDPAKYGALVFNDTVLLDQNFSAMSDINMTNIFADGIALPPKGWESDVNISNENLFAPGVSGRGLVVPLTVLHNTSSDHALPVFIQELAQARLRATLGRPSAYLKASSHPLPLTKDEALEIKSVLAILAALFVLIPFCYLAASFAVFVVRERAVKAKLLQMVSGANVYTYWFATYTWDMVNYVAIVAITLLVFFIYRDDAFVGTWLSASAVTILLVAFGLSVVPLSYVYAFGFSNHASAQVAIAGIHFVTGFVMVVASIVMGALEETKAVNNVLVHVYRLFPPYNLGKGLVSLSALQLEVSVLGGRADPYQWNIIGQPLCFMFLEALGYMILTLLIDSDALARAWAVVKDFASFPYLQRHSFVPGKVPVAEDVDVLTERKRVEESVRKDAVTMQRLRKVYPGNKGESGKAAVRDLSLGIPAGECFGFLGVNGAGKTTTLSMLTGDIKPTSGNAFINGYSVLTELPLVQKQIGYCPQFDPLLDLMTAREHLQMYARLKGVPKSAVNAMVDEMLNAVGLEKYANVVSGSYSGGNKRKLSLAIALIGDPAVVFLDEPGSGMDPVARRAMWDLIVQAVSQRNVAMVLTTHSMEECEALCSRVGVMVAGSLVCLGPIQHIKSRFGEGYTVEMKYTSPEAPELIAQFMSANFSGAKLVEQHAQRLTYRLPSEGAPLSLIFGAVQKEQERVGVVDYCVSQSTLEQVFLSFAKQRPEDV